MPAARARRIAARGRDAHRRGSRCRRPAPARARRHCFHLYYQAFVTLITDAAIVTVGTLVLFARRDA